MWSELVKNDQVDFESSFYCGDAAGRAGDHSNDDMLYAQNIGLKFLTPEMLFLGQKINFKPISGLKGYENQEQIFTKKELLNIKMFENIGSHGE